LESRTRATFRRAELGFLGVTVITRVQLPRFWGHNCKAGDFVLEPTCCRPKRTNWFIVGIKNSLFVYYRPLSTAKGIESIRREKKDQGVLEKIFEFFP
jgi:hypothetical protein